MAWTAEKVSADAASKIQVGAGLILNKFEIATPTEPQDADIVCETTGDFHLTCTPEMEDIFADVNNAPKDTKEGKRIKSWKCGLSVTCLSFTDETLKTALAAADGTGTEGVNPREQIQTTDFKKLYWVGDMMTDDKLFVVAMDDAVNTTGIDFTATDDGKGKLALNIVPHASFAKPHVVPMAFYILTKQGA